MATHLNVFQNKSSAERKLTTDIVQAFEVKIQLCGTELLSKRTRTAVKYSLCTWKVGYN